MNKNKCVKKQKLSKKNKNKNKNKTNKFLYKIHGGSNTNATASHTPPKLNTTPLRLIDLIQNAKLTRVIIMFNGLKIKCIIGDNEIEFNKGKKWIACITLKYDFAHTNAELSNFFYSKNKSDCISKDSNINNTEYKKLHNTLEKKDEYKKDLNKLLLTLTDIINIHLQMTHCVVMDAAFITCNKFNISLDIKHYARGYGFYNEFGYIYINKNKDKNVNTTDTLEKKIIYANKILDLIHDLSHKTLIELEDNIKALKEKADLNGSVFSFNDLFIKNLLELCKILNISNDPTKTVRQLLNEIFHRICNITDIKTIENIKEVINDNQDYLYLFIAKMFALQRIISKCNPAPYEFHKFYDTTNKDGRIYTSELKIPIPSDEKSVPSFEMKAFTQPNITIISGSGSGIDDYEYEYIINIE